MILARLSSAIREQNWFAVVLEFFIVIAGVVIGFQITAWNADRAEQALEQVYLQRLHDEAVNGLDGILESTDRNWTNISTLLQEAVNIISANSPETEELSDEQCAALSRVSSIIAFPYQFPTLKEILASGRLSVIRDAGLRAALTDYDIMQENSRSLVAHYTEGAIALHLDFPHLVTSEHVSVSGALVQRYSCDLAGMRADPVFIAHLHEGVSRFQGYYNIVLRGEVDSVRDIHSRISAMPGIVTAEAEE